jgi:hypothetical protein
MLGRNGYCIDYHCYHLLRLFHNARSYHDRPEILTQRYRGHLLRSIKDNVIHLMEPVLQITDPTAPSRLNQTSLVLDNAIPTKT